MAEALCSTADLDAHAPAPDAPADKRRRAAAALTKAASPKPDSAISQPRGTGQARSPKEAASASNMRSTGKVDITQPSNAATRNAGEASAASATVRASIPLPAHATTPTTPFRNEGAALRSGHACPRCDSALASHHPGPGATRPIHRSSRRDGEVAGRALARPSDLANRVSGRVSSRTLADSP